MNRTHFKFSSRNHYTIKKIGINTEFCSDMNGSNEFNCNCYTGFEGKRCEISVCDSVICPNGSCYAGDCICDDGYVNIRNICEETCALNPCQELINVMLHAEKTYQYLYVLAF